MDRLITSLLDLLHELESQKLSIMVGGGFGLFLKRCFLNEADQRTLFDRLPEPRATNDLDLFLRVEVLTDLDRTRSFAEAIRRLGYTAVEEAKFLQWKRYFPERNDRQAQEVKIDVLVGPLGNHRRNLHVKMPRVRPKGEIEFHAHAVEEAIHLEDEPIAVTIVGTRSTGESMEGAVNIPQAFPYLMMKLHAFNDRKKDENKDLGRHHALDLYAIVGMMSETEYERAKELGATYAANRYVRRARAVVGDHFGSATAIGVLRLREHKLFRQDFMLTDFMDVLGEIFSTE